MKNIFIMLLVTFFISGSLFPQVVINDEFFENQWYLNMPGNENTRADIRILDAWARTLGNSSQNIADIEGSDGGYPSIFHEDLLNRITDHGTGFTGEHATNVVGLIVANHNSIGIAGVNKYAKINSYVFEEIDEWDDKVRDARLDGNKIINISQGIYDPLPDVYMQLAEAYSNNIVTIVSVGNNNTNITYPAVYQGVIAVGSSTKDNTSSFFSNFGPQIDLLAPGGSDFTANNPKNIFTTSSNGGYVYSVGGTSLAAPLVSGAASLLLDYKPDLTNVDVKNILINSCDKLPQMQGANFTNECGYGRINLKKAMQLLEPPYSIFHGNATLTKLEDNITEIFVDNPVLANGTYYVDKYKLSVDRNDLNYLEAPIAWLPKGYSGANPNNSQEFLSISITANSIHAYTFFYYVRTNFASEPIFTWFPYDPSEYYTILGKSAVINVPEEYATIESALNAAISGQTVIVSSGNYTIGSNLSVQSGRTLSVNSGAVLTFNSGKKVSVYGGGVLNANGATFKGNGTAGNWNSISFYANSSGSIQNSTIKDAQCGIYATTNTNVTVSNNSITNNSVYGLSIISNSDATISDNTISNNGTGINVSTSGVTISGNTIEDNTNYGINASNISYNFYWHDNTLEGNGYAIFLNNASPYIYKNTISENDHGITISSSNPSFSSPSPNDTMRGYNAVTCNTATPNFKAENYSTVYAGYGYDGGYNSIFGSELPDMEAKTHSGIYACNNYWGPYSPAVYADGTSSILTWYPLSTDPNPGSCIAKSSPMAKNAAQSEDKQASSISEKYWQAISDKQKGDISSAKNLLKSIISDSYDNNILHLLCLHFTI